MLIRPSQPDIIVPHLCAPLADNGIMRGVGRGFGNLRGVMSLPLFRAALAGQDAGTIQPRMLCVGDSTTFGGGSDLVDLKPNNWVTKLKSSYVSGGRVASASSFVGGGSFYADNISHDGRVTAPVGWSRQTLPTVGGDLLKSGTTDVFAFLPTENVDTFDIWYVSTPSSGVLRFNINGGTNTDVPTLDAVDGMKKVTITGTLGSNTLNMSRLSGGTVFIMSINAYDSSNKTLEIMNAGYSGAQSTDINDSTYSWSPLNAIPFYDPDLTLLMLGINDWNGLGGVVSAAQYKINMQAIIDATTGDIAICTPVPTRNSKTLLTTQQTYVDKMHELAVENNITIIDIFAEWVSWEISDPLGRYFDDVHPSASGYTDMADFIYNALPK